MDGRGLARIYKMNQSYFSNITEESAQWAGYIAADGTLYDNGRVKFACAIKDKNILFELKKDMEFEHPIRTCSYNLKGKRYYGVETTIFSKIMCKDLGTIYNITPRKSLTMKAPEISDSKIRLAFLIGLINGDGSIYKITKSNILTLNLTGTFDICKWARDVLYEYIGNKGEKYIYPNGSIWSLKYNRPDVITFLYAAKKLNCFYLDRKWSKIYLPNTTPSGKEREAQHF